MLGHQPSGRAGVHEALEMVKHRHAVQVRHVLAQLVQVFGIPLHDEILPPIGTCLIPGAHPYNIRPAPFHPRPAVAGPGRGCR